MDFDKEKFEDLKSKMAAFYQGLQPLRCQALDEIVHFTSDGFHHLRFDGTRAERTKLEQYVKLKFLKAAIEIIRKTTTIQEIRKETQPIGKPGRDGFRKTAEVTYWGFIALVKERVRVKVVLRRVGSGNVHFWSVMPFWKDINIIPGQSIRRLGSVDIADE